jgi:uncharacterized protein (DUF433 family)
MVATKLSVMLDWTSCTAVERSQERVSGVWLFRGTRVPVQALFQNLKMARRWTNSWNGFLA